MSPKYPRHYNNTISEAWKELKCIQHVYLFFNVTIMLGVTISCQLIRRLCYGKRNTYGHAVNITSCSLCMQNKKIGVKTNAKISIFWDTMRSTPLKIVRHLEGICRQSSRPKNNLGKKPVTCSFETLVDFQ
jgi:hypothetical protein